jgi:hypothetical protein
LASWLFMQYLLTNDVQVAYAKTEGYVPVTTKAQNSDEYLEYLARCGENHATYYDVKIKATQLLLDNIDNTFVTPVFNGSTSLRDAAGQLIENVAKSVKRKEIVDAEYIETLYSDVQSLYRLSQAGMQNNPDTAGGGDLGALPKTARIFLASLIAAWVFIALYVVITAVKKKISKRI